jgi:hypothetical protein
MDACIPQGLSHGCLVCGCIHEVMFDSRSQEPGARGRCYGQEGLRHLGRARRRSPVFRILDDRDPSSWDAIRAAGIRVSRDPRWSGSEVVGIRVSRW